MKKIKELIEGTAFITVPIIACLVYGLACKILGL